MRFQYFVCGPGRMLDAMEKHLTALGIPPAAQLNSQIVGLVGG
jgi:ferredoxin-NADP reductase